MGQETTIGYYEFSSQVCAGLSRTGSQQEIRKQDEKHFIHWFIHSFLPIVMCLPGAKHYSKHWGSTCRPFRLDSSFYQASFLINEAENQQIEQSDRKNKRWPREGQKGRHLAPETGNRQSRWDCPSEGAAQVTQENCLPSKGNEPRLLQSDPHPVREITPPLICRLLSESRYLSAHHPM